MSIEQTIRETLTREFNPEQLKVANQSHFHAGHASTPGTGESHFAVAIVSAAFTGKSRLERHRLVNAALASAFNAGVHALAIKAYAPGEAIR
jgi:BolA family transcriptional regulator, general stress-responsive regulator